jgi:hypothetical protein
MTIMTKHQMSLVPYHVKSLQDQEVEHTNNLPWQTKLNCDVE